MRLTTYVIQKTGLTADQLFGVNDPLVVIAQDIEGHFTIPVWTVPNVVAPTADDIAAALAAPEPGPSLAAAQAAQIAVLRAACSAAILTGGFASSALGSVHGYPSDTTSQMNLAASVVASLLPNLISGWTTLFWCADATGAWTFAPHTAAQIQQVGVDGKAMVVAAQQNLATLTAAIQAAATVAAVQAVVWS